MFGKKKNYLVVVISPDSKYEVIAHEQRRIIHFTSVRSRAGFLPLVAVMEAENVGSSPTGRAKTTKGNTMTMYDPECDGIYDEVYDPREEDDVYPPFITSVLCHNPKCE